MTNATRSDEFWKWYRAYLEGDDWGLIRAKVLARDKWMCRGCGDRATQAHHLTYAHVGAEFMFELVAVCEECHDRLHRPHIALWGKPQ
jgi:5-methylcytosine-specific restriction endonuclease McrA